MSINTFDPPIASARSGIAWGPVLGAAVVATAVTALLVALGSGLGCASVSPSSGGNPSATTFTVLAATWLLIVQWVSSCFGAFIACVAGAIGGRQRDSY
jgi:hypothetical protein